MTREQKFILESISYLVKSGFWDTEEIEEFITHEIQENELQKEVSEKWVKEIIQKEQRNVLKESKNWHVPTTTQKLMVAFDQLIDKNIIALHHAGYSSEDGYYEVEQIEDRLRENGKKSKGICFYHEQDLQRSFDTKDPILTLAFYDLNSNQEQDSIAVGRSIVEVLNNNGFLTEWNNTVSEKITIKNFAWQQVYKPENTSILDYDNVTERLLGIK
ncbi:hypothetical protein LNQ81_11855 [Myroides sp. M-43]|uniref:DUF6891 domain-containing protein n=1 Tax=Myroides oncorhynchi TaxID=2893756 RepID=UPI001E358013|nr:hypothetical protein [Myroides oncorhynchi]MCC9043364.1 hypothetical protein [Myroides oncorhynchi]